MRCFVAVWPDAGALEALATLPRPALDGVRWSGRDQWHVTLRFFGDVAPAEVARATAVLAEVAGKSNGPITAQGGPSTRFLGPGLIVWPVKGLANIARAVEGATAAIGQPVPERPFVGHLTVARARRGTDLRTARQLLHPLTSSWPVGSLSMVQSELHREGARYRDLGSFPLVERGPGAIGVGAVQR